MRDLTDVKVFAGKLRGYDTDHADKAADLLEAQAQEVEWLRLALAGAAFCKHSGGIFWTWNKNLSAYGYFYALPDDNLTCRWGGTTLNDAWHAIGLAIREGS